nr:hypothetical protein [Thioalkalivibrio sp. AKL19]
MRRGPVAQRRGILAPRLTLLPQWRGILGLTLSLRLALASRWLALPLGRGGRAALTRRRLAAALHLAGGVLPLRLAGGLLGLPRGHALPTLLALAAWHTALPRHVLPARRRGTPLGGRRALPHATMMVVMLRGLRMGCANGEEGTEGDGQCRTAKSRHGKTPCGR